MRNAVLYQDGSLLVVKQRAKTKDELDEIADLLDGANRRVKKDAPKAKHVVVDWSSLIMKEV